MKIDYFTSSASDVRIIYLNMIFDVIWDDGLTAGETPNVHSSCGILTLNSFWNGNKNEEKKKRRNEMIEIQRNIYDAPSPAHCLRRVVRYMQRY